jgi:hypothetical protein
MRWRIQSKDIAEEKMAFSEKRKPLFRDRWKITGS